mmetsp:Transcript_115776/g.338607  ORF Transcript_115776/g.338607 Transcript_115776/m.338607 type:complete len:406 (+) Transcript_115776:48-1265(+)
MDLGCSLCRIKPHTQASRFTSSSSEPGSAAPGTGTSAEGASASSSSAQAFGRSPTTSRCPPSFESLPLLARSLRGSGREAPPERAAPGLAGPATAAQARSASSSAFKPVAARRTGSPPVPADAMTTGGLLRKPKRRASVCLPELSSKSSQQGNRATRMPLGFRSCAACSKTFGGLASAERLVAQATSHGAPPKRMLSTRSGSWADTRVTSGQIQSCISSRNPHRPGATVRTRKRRLRRERRSAASGSPCASSASSFLAHKSSPSAAPVLAPPRARASSSAGNKLPRPPGDVNAAAAAALPAPLTPLFLARRPSDRSCGCCGPSSVRPRGLHAGTDQSCCSSRSCISREGTSPSAPSSKSTFQVPSSLSTASTPQPLPRHSTREPTARPRGAMRRSCPGPLEGAGG